MLMASFEKEGRHRLVVGLEEENLRRLRDDMPILRSLDEAGIEGWDLLILGPEDMARFVAQFGPDEGELSKESDEAQ